MASVARDGSPEATAAGASWGRLVGMKTLVANRLYDADGNLVGKLEEIVLDVRTGCVRHVVVAVGGVMGIGRRRLAVPWHALIPDADYRRCLIDVAQMRLTAVPVPDSDPWLQRAKASRVVDAGTLRSPRAWAGD